MIETGRWQTIHDEPRLASDVLSQFNITIFSDGTIQLQVRTSDDRPLSGQVEDMELARDKLTAQLRERFARCPLFRAGANDQRAA
jgi:hypothetical protein